MRHRSIATTQSLRPLLQRLAFAMLVLLSAFLLVAEKREQGVAEALRLSVLDVVSPMADVLTSPVTAFEKLVSAWDHYWFVYSENDQLRADNERLIQWRASALRLEAENEALRQLLDYQPMKVTGYMTGKVLGHAVGGLSQRLQLNIGAHDGVAAHMPVINEHGLVGRLTSVSPNRSELLLLTDMSSRIPVELQPSGLRAILIGDHHQMPYLKLSDPKAQPALGDTVLTSGDGEVMPAGLYVGKLFAERDGRYEIRPAFQEKRLDFVRVMRTTPQ